MFICVWMRIAMRFFTALMMMLVTFSLGACASGRAKLASVDSVAQYVSSKSKNVVIIDANDEDTRKAKGVVPGAVKLSAYDTYAMSELPADKNTPLIFYCYNSLCPASGLAADRAMDAGYADVSVMKAGIVGWKERQDKLSASNISNTPR
jgi:rhodanese-related sulfurtransferase